MLGPWRTVKGYLDLIANRSLLAERDIGPLPQVVSRNWDSLVADLPRKWRPEVFVDRLTEFHRLAGWDFYRSQRRSALGREHVAHFNHPSTVDLVHSDYKNVDKPTWHERALMALGWQCVARDGKAKIDIQPSTLLVSQHALERLYERTGGVDYGLYPNLVVELCDTVQGKVETLFNAGVMLPAGAGKMVTAAPACDGLALIEITRVFTALDIPQLGSRIDVRGGDVSLKASSIPLERMLIDARFYETMSYATFFVMRTFYGPDELRGSKTDAVELLNLVLDHLSDCGARGHSRYPEADAKTAIAEPAHMSARAFESLVADTVKTLHWLNDRPDVEYLLYSSGQGRAASEGINARRGGC